LRRHRRPVTAQQLTTELSVSVRTIYRDIDTLALSANMVLRNFGLTVFLAQVGIASLT
jgi:DeoR/GlpR family transcriptional regulator of sugar metabolism